MTTTTAGLANGRTLASYARSGRRLGHGRVAGLAALVGPAGRMCGGLLGGQFGLPFAGFPLRELRSPLPDLCARRTSP